MKDLRLENFPQYNR